MSTRNASSILRYVILLGAVIVQHLHEQLKYGDLYGNNLHAGTLTMEH